MIYYGITIGPIVKTLGMTNTPAGLWTASYMFSYVTKTLLELLKEKKADILIPYYEENSTNNEVGSYPDHIIFKGNLDDSTIQKMINDAKEKVVDIITRSLFPNDYDYNRKVNDVKEFMRKYISIQCVKKDISKGNNIILEMSKLLDHIELSESFVMTDNGQFLSMLFSGDGNTSGSSKSSREYIKRFIGKVIEDKKIKPQVQNEDERGSLKDIESICNIPSLNDLKITDYYAIVYADGDSMTDLFKEIGNNKLKDFSKECLIFTQEAAKKIKEYGGVTIYVGGDDLLFIAPLCSINVDKTIFELCQELSAKFSNDMKKIDPNANVSMSFGVSISFLRSPLYEALNKARTMLFDEAKELNKEEKNAIAVTLSKASGQSLSMCMSFNSELYTQWVNFLNDFYINVQKKKIEEKDKSYDSSDTDASKSKDSEKNVVDIDMMNSIIYTIENYSDLFNIATKKKGIENFFINMTDNSHQECYKEYIKSVANLYSSLDKAKEEKKFKIIGDNHKKNTSLSGILRLSKFYLEKSNQDKEGK